MPLYYPWWYTQGCICLPNPVCRWVCLPGMPLYYPFHCWSYTAVRAVSHRCTHLEEYEAQRGLLSSRFTVGFISQPPSLSPVSLLGLVLSLSFTTRFTVGLVLSLPSNHPFHCWVCTPRPFHPFLSRKWPFSPLFYRFLSRKWPFCFPICTRP